MSEAKIAAIFDLDDTLLVESSGRLFLRYLRSSGQLLKYFPRRRLMGVFSAPLLYKVGLINVDRFMERTVMIAEGLRLDDVWTMVQGWFEAVGVHHISEAGNEQLNWHIQNGHIPIICSASSQFSVLPIARHLGIEHAIFTEWLSEGEELTGKVRTPIVYGPGKVHWVRRWAETHNVDLSQSYFYSDHISDRPLLELVGHPVVVNPHRRLAKLALRNNWPVRDWR